MVQDIHEQKELNVNPSSATNSTVSPGQLLKAAREAQYRTQAEIAERLHLGVSVIKRIENDDYSYSQAPVYIRGYLRAYARVVNLPEHKVLQALQATGIELPEVEYRPTSITQTVPVYAQGGNSRTRLIRWTSILMGLVVVAMATMWWEGQKGHKLGQGQAQMQSQPQVDAPMYQMPESNNAPAGNANSSVAPTTNAQAEANVSNEPEATPREATPPVKSQLSKAKTYSSSYKVTPVQPSED